MNLDGQAKKTMNLDGQTIESTICDAAHITAFARATDLGLTRNEHPKQINENPDLLARVRQFSGQAAYSVGMCRSRETVDEDSPILPMGSLLSKTVQNSCAVKAVSRWRVSHWYGRAGRDVSASMIEGNVVAEVVRGEALGEKVFKVLHPGG